MNYTEQLGERISTFGLVRNYSYDLDSVSFGLLGTFFIRNLSGYKPHTKDNEVFDFFFSRKLLPTLKFFTSIQSNLYQNRSEAIIPQLGSFTPLVSKFHYVEDYTQPAPSNLIQRRGNFLVGLESFVINHYLQTGTGFSYDQDNDDIGKGMTAQFIFESKPTISPEWKSNYQFNYEHHWLRPRKFSKGNLLLEFNWSNLNFGSFADIQTQIQRFERDIPGINGFRRSEWNGTANIKVHTPITKNSQFSLSSNIEGFKIRQGELFPSSSQIKHFHTFEWLWSKDLPFVTVFYGTGYQTTRFGELLQNHQSENLGLNTGIKNSLKDSLSIFIEGFTTRISTPDTGEYSDRDEVQWRGTLSGTKSISPKFLLQSHIQYIFNHPIYLSKYTSSSNRSLRSYFFDIHAKHFFSRQGFHHLTLEMFSSFILYDFPMQEYESRDVFFRRFSFLDSLAFPLLIGQTLFKIRSDLEDRGIYYRTTHEVALAESFHTLTSSLQYQFNLKKVFFTLGFQGYRRKPFHYRHLLTKQTSNSTLQSVQGYGPILEFQHQFTNQWRVYNRTNVMFISKMKERREVQTNWVFTLSKVW